MPKRALLAVDPGHEVQQPVDRSRSKPIQHWVPLRAASAWLPPVAKGAADNNRMRFETETVAEERVSDLSPSRPHPSGLVARTPS
jgi:hypothetical protein